MRIVLGVTGGIAAYKSALLLRLMREAGHTVDVVPTDASLNFVGIATWEALSGRPVHTGTFEAVDQVNHVLLGRQAELVVVAPATADSLARAAQGLAPDLLGNVLLTATCPVLMVPAMHTEMWLHPATQANVQLLRERGVHVMDPDSGRLTGADSGPGRLPEPEAIWAEAQRVAATSPRSSRAAATTDPAAAETAAAAQAATVDEPAPRAAAPADDRESWASVLSSPSASSAARAESGPLNGRTVVVTAGGTRESLDPVRYLGNRSSGKMGVALAEAALAAGATVRFIGAAMDVPAPEGAQIVRVESTEELRRAVLKESTGADALIMAAAVADFRPADYTDAKIKKSDDGSSPVITLERTPDILAETVQARNAGQGLPPVIVGFAAETGDASGSVLEYGAAKLARKGCEALVVNQVGRDLVFGQDTTEIAILFADERDPVHATGTKDQAAQVVVTVLGELVHAAG